MNGFKSKGELFFPTDKTNSNDMNPKTKSKTGNGQNTRQAGTSKDMDKAWSKSKTVIQIQLSKSLYKGLVSL